MADVQAAEQRVETSNEELNTLMAGRILERAIALDPEAGRRMAAAVKTP